jgi:hypothetical protein
MKGFSLAVILSVLATLTSYAQDTIIYNKNKYKFGLKMISENSGDNEWEEKTFHVWAGGIQVVRKIENTKYSFESGLYFNTKVKQHSVEYKVEDPNSYPPYRDFLQEFYYHYLHVPFNFRLDCRSIYISSGIFGDYLLYRSKWEYEDRFRDSIDFKGEDRKFGFGININTGLETPISQNISLFVEARYAVTITSAKTGKGLTTDNIHSTFSNSNYGFAIGINYGYTKKKNNTKQTNSN